MVAKKLKLMALAVGIAGMLSLSVQASQVEGIRFDKSFESSDTNLELRGVGLLKYLGLFKAYAGALYLEEGISAEDALTDKAKRIEVEYLRPFKGEDFGPATVEMMRKNVDPSTLERLSDQIAYHNSLYEDVGPGDRYALTYIPGIGTELSLNGETKGVIAGAEFATALFSIWIGTEPIDEGFKRQIMGL
jgi:hypothetical protein